MSENNLPNEEMENEVVNSAEETDVVEEVAEKVEEIAEEAEEIIEDVKEFVAEKVMKANYKKSAIVAWVLVALLLVVDVWYYMTNIYNKYNNMGYYDITGYTVGESIAGMGMDFEEFKEMYGLPEDMRKDTNMNAAQSMIPVSKMAELNGMDIETLKASYKFGEEINENSTWGEAVESMLLRDYVGESQFESFKATYGYGDEITLDTKWGEIREEVEKKQMIEKKAEKKIAEEMEQLSEENQQPVDEEPAEDAGAEATDVPAEVGQE